MGALFGCSSKVFSEQFNILNIDQNTFIKKLPECVYLLEVRTQTKWITIHEKMLKKQRSECNVGSSIFDFHHVSRKINYRTFFL